MFYRKIPSVLSISRQEDSVIAGDKRHHLEKGVWVDLNSSEIILEAKPVDE
jgi:hypothetical protein